MRPQPSRGEIWEIDLGRTRGHEQAGRRPGLVVSTDRLNHGPAGLVVLLPITTVDKRIPLHVAVEPPEGGLARTSFVKPEDIRPVSSDRLGRRLGAVSRETMGSVEARLRVVLDL